MGDGAPSPGRADTDRTTTRTTDVEIGPTIGGGAEGEPEHGSFGEQDPSAYMLAVGKQRSALRRWRVHARHVRRTRAAHEMRITVASEHEARRMRTVAFARWGVLIEQQQLERDMAARRQESRVRAAARQKLRPVVHAAMRKWATKAAAARGELRVQRAAPFTVGPRARRFNAQLRNAVRKWRSAASQSLRRARQIDRRLPPLSRARRLPATGA